MHLFFNHKEHGVYTEEHRESRRLIVTEALIQLGNMNVGLIKYQDQSLHLVSLIMHLFLTTEVTTKKGKGINN